MEISKRNNIYAGKGENNNLKDKMEKKLNTRLMGEKRGNTL